MGLCCFSDASNWIVLLLPLLSNQMLSKLGKKWNKRGQWQRSFPQRAKSVMKCYEKRWDRQAQRQNTQVGWQRIGVSFSSQAGWEITITPVHMHVLTHSYTIFMCALENLIKLKCSFLLITLSAAILHTCTHPSPHTHVLILAALYHQNCKTFQHRQTSLHFFLTWVISSSFSGPLKWTYLYLQVCL